MPIYTDDFNRANANLNTGNWASIPGFQLMAINTNQVVPSNNGTDCCSLYVLPGGFIQDQYSQVTIMSLLGTTDQAGSGVYLRGDPSVAGGIWVVVNTAATNNISIASWSAGSYALLAQRTKSPAPAAGDILKATISGIDTAQIVKVYINGVQIGADVTSSELDNNDVGYPGVCFSSAMTNYNIDDWEGGDLSSATIDSQATRMDAHAGHFGPF